MDLGQAIFVPLVALLIAVLCSCGDDGVVRKQAYVKASQAQQDVQSKPADETKR